MYVNIALNKSINSIYAILESSKKKGAESTCFIGSFIINYTSKCF